MTRYQQFLERWKDGCGSSLCEGARICSARGAIPCQVLCVGEAPGESENTLGKPFCGPAGQLLDKEIRQAGIPAEVVAFTNLVGCIPHDDTGTKLAQPPKEAIDKCAPRLKEIITICRPRLIVWVGQLSEKHGPPTIDMSGAIAQCGIVHPAAILRAHITQQGLMKQRSVVALSTAWEALHAQAH